MQITQSRSQVNHTNYKHNTRSYTDDRCPHNSNQFTFVKDISISPLESIYFHTRDRRSRLAEALQPQKCHRLLLVLLAGDIATNPGPTKFPCGVCARPVAKNHRALQCESCENWIHIKCGKVTPAEYILLGNLEDPWFCKTCNDLSNQNYNNISSTIKLDMNSVNGTNDPDIATLNISIEPTSNQDLEQSINIETSSTCLNINNINDSLVFQPGDFSLK